MHASSPYRSRLRWLTMVVVVALAGVIVANITPLPAPPAARGAESTSLALPGGVFDVADVVDAVGPAVVFIEVAYEQPQSGRQGVPFPFGDIFGMPDGWWPFPQPGPTGGSGSGFVIDESGLVLTNQHLFAQPDLISGIRVTLPGHEETYDAQLIGSDFELDLAVLELDGEGPFPTVPLGDSDAARVGEFVVAIGNPYRLEHTVTGGLLSAKGRELQVVDRDEQRTRTYRNLMQTDAAINPGNSGGPLLNMQGEAIGINTAVRADAQGIGFAIPVNAAKEVLDDLINRGMVVRPFIGIRYMTVDEAIVRQLRLPVDEGIIVVDVLPDTAAARAGLRLYDVITQVGREEVRSEDDFMALVEGMEVGDVLLLTVIRDGREIAVRLEVGERPPQLAL